MHDNGMSAERLRARSVVRACDGRWKRSGGIRDPPKGNLLRALEDSRCHPPANENASVMPLPDAAAGGVIGLVEEGEITEICARERRIGLTESDTVLKERRTAREFPGWRPPRGRERCPLRFGRMPRWRAARRPALSEYCLTSYCPTTTTADDIVRMGELPFALESAITT